MQTGAGSMREDLDFSHNPTALKIVMCCVCDRIGFVCPCFEKMFGCVQSELV